MGSDEDEVAGDSGHGPGTVMVLVDGEVELVVGRVDDLRSDLTLVDTLARLQLAARRIGCSIHLRDPSRDLCCVLELAGLADVFSTGSVRPVAVPAGNPIVDAMELGWREFRASVARVGPAGLDRVTGWGWTAKEMLGHMAFWEETLEPVVVMFRGGRLPEGWAFGSGYTHPDGPWPSADEHNAREAAWARSRPPEQVVGRLDAGHARALEIAWSLSGDELADPRYQRYLGDRARHYDEHRLELEGLRPRR